MKLIYSAAIACACALSMMPQQSQASDRRFAFVYETTTAPKGSWEYEQWITWKAYRGGGARNVFDFTHELEYGLTDNLQLGLYLSDWTLESGKEGRNAKWESAGAEIIWSLSNPTTDFLGSALYGEVKWGDEVFSLEGKLLLQKNLGPWVIAYNAIVEAEWEGTNYDERVGVLEQTIGISYQISPRFSVGIEALHEVEFEDWDESGDNVVFVGPNFSVRGKEWYATGAVLFEASGLDEEPKVQSRLILGFDF